MSKKKITPEEYSLIKTLIDMFSNRDIELKKVKKELRKKFNLNLSLNQLTKIEKEMRTNREETTKEQKND